MFGPELNARAGFQIGQYELVEVDPPNHLILVGCYVKNAGKIAGLERKRAPAVSADLIERHRVPRPEAPRPIVLSLCSTIQQENAAVGKGTIRELVGKAEARKSSAGHDEVVGTHGDRVRVARAARTRKQGGRRTSMFPGESTLHPRSCFVPHLRMPTGTGTLSGQGRRHLARTAGVCLLPELVRASRLSEPVLPVFGAAAAAPR